MIKPGIVIFILSRLNILSKGYQFQNCYNVESGLGPGSFQRMFIFPKTTLNCMTKCLESYKYAATKYDEDYEKEDFECYCSNDIQLTGVVQGTDCGMPCPSISSIRCGHIGRLAVYIVEDTAPTTFQQFQQETTTEDIEFTTTIATTTYQSTTISTTTPVSTVQTDVLSTDIGDTTVVATTPYQSTTISTTAPVSPLQNEGYTIATAIPPVQTMTTMTSPGSSIKINNCSCPCNMVSNRWDFLLIETYTIDELKQLLRDNLDELESQVAIDKSQTLLSIYKKRCMDDDRPTSTVIGVFGAVMICIPLMILFFCDFAGLLCRKRKRY